MQLTTISGKSPLAAAIRYALTRMERLRPYLDYGTLELDNNTAERGMRAIALGRKNYLFVGSEAGGKAAAIARTLIETAKLNAVDPHAWLADTLSLTTRSTSSKICAGPERGGDRAAFMYSLIVTAKMGAVDPQAWLGDVLARLPGTTASRVPDLLLWNWPPTRQRMAA